MTTIETPLPKVSSQSGEQKTETTSLFGAGMFLAGMLTGLTDSPYLFLSVLSASMTLFLIGAWLRYVMKRMNMEANTKIKLKENTDENDAAV